MLRGSRASSGQDSKRKLPHNMQGPIQVIYIYTFLGTLWTKLMSCFISTACRETRSSFSIKLYSQSIDNESFRFTKKRHNTEKYCKGNFRNLSSIMLVHSQIMQNHYSVFFSFRNFSHNSRLDQNNSGILIWKLSTRGIDEL